MTLFKAEEPSLQTVTLEMLEVAFTEELTEFLRQAWPNAWFADDSERSIEFRRIWPPIFDGYPEEVAILVRAAARLGCTIHLVPLPKSVPDREQEKPRPGKRRRSPKK